MPRYRFNWRNLDPDLLQALATHCRLDGDPPESLQSAFGARPKVEFIGETWPALLTSWLPNDDRAKVRLARMLRARGVGRPELEDDLAYLETVRNTAATRKLAIELFIEAGEQTADVRQMVEVVSEEPAGEQPAPPPGAEADAAGDAPTEEDPPPASGNDPLRQWVGNCIEDIFGPVHVDSDGDFVLPTGSAIVYVSPIHDPDRVRVFAILLREVADSPKVLPLINAINLQVPLGRLSYVGERIVLEQTIFPPGLSQQNLELTVGIISRAADFFDHRLQAEVGGVTALRERAADEIDV
jgi:hypothetical protein